MSARICPQCGRRFEGTVKFCPEDGATLRAASPETELIGLVLADRYHVLGKLGAGGMGQVYLAEHVRMKRKCAVKVMHARLLQDAEAVGRFTREAANASQISNPHVATVYDFGETPDGLVFLAMEYVDGLPLGKLIEQNLALPAPRAAEIIRQASEGLGAAHDLGIVHRDLKPDNIMVARQRDGSDHVKVVDFGIAKVWLGSTEPRVSGAVAGGMPSQQVTRTGFVVGTPEYMSPEQIAGDLVDARSDIYSLALVAFNAFTGKLPFPGRTSQESMIMRLTEQPCTLSEMRDDVPWPITLQEVMDRALARGADERYQSAPEFGRDLVAALEGMPYLTAEQLGARALFGGDVRSAPPSPDRARLVRPPKSKPARDEGVEPAELAAVAGVRPSAPTVSTPIPPWRPPNAGGEGAPPAEPAGGAPLPAPSSGRGRRRLLAAAVGAVVIAAGVYAVITREAPPTPPGSGAVASPDSGGTTAALPASPPAATPLATPPAAPGPSESAAAPGTAELRLPPRLPAGAVVTVGGVRVRESTVSLLPGRVEVALFIPGQPARRTSLTLRAGEAVVWPTAAVLAGAEQATREADAQRERALLVPPAQRASAAAAAAAEAAQRESAAPIVVPAPPPVVIALPPAPQGSVPESATRAATDRAAADRAAADRVATIAGIDRALGEFARAFESRRIDEVRRVFPGMTAESQRRWTDLLSERSITALRASASRSQSPDIDGNVATVSYTMQLEYLQRGERYAPVLEYRATLRREGPGATWRIVSVSGR